MGFVTTWGIDTMEPEHTDNATLSGIGPECPGCDGCGMAAQTGIVYFAGAVWHRVCAAIAAASADCDADRRHYSDHGYGYHRSPIMGGL